MPGQAGGRLWCPRRRAPVLMLTHRPEPVRRRRDRCVTSCSAAVAANDLQLLSGGRFGLGLGSQMKTHITRRFGMPWSNPAARLREFVQPARAPPGLLSVPGGAGRLFLKGAGM
jgi:hypothetical protein